MSTIKPQVVGGALKTSLGTSSRRAKGLSIPYLFSLFYFRKLSLNLNQLIYYVPHSRESGLTDRLLTNWLRIWGTYGLRSLFKVTRFEVNVDTWPFSLIILTLTSQLGKQERWVQTTPAPNIHHNMLAIFDKFWNRIFFEDMLVSFGSWSGMSWPAWPYITIV